MYSQMQSANPGSGTGGQHVHLLRPKGEETVVVLPVKKMCWVEGSTRESLIPQTAYVSGYRGNSSYLMFLLTAHT
jgi:hypothetical protein